MHRTSDNVWREFEYPPAIATEEQQADLQKTYDCLFNRIKSELMELHPAWRPAIKRDSNGITFGIAEEYPNLDASLDESISGFVQAGIFVSKRNSSRMLDLPLEKVAEILNTTPPERRILLSRTMFWSYVLEAIDLMEEVPSEIDEMDDEYGLMDGLPYADDKPFEPGSYTEAEDEDQDPRENIDVQHCLAKLPWLKPLYYSILAGNLDHTASYPRRK